MVALENGETPAGCTWSVRSRKAKPEEAHHMPAESDPFSKAAISTYKSLETALIQKRLFFM
ncbi:hypothetical protein [Halobacillus campisalis]|uniref:hypothetical protein n=1 Tax=Halobacillus campisalis TaxID=435909 RepID=UPI0036F29741